jgi:hypothetical protein
MDNIISLHKDRDYKMLPDINKDIKLSYQKTHFERTLNYVQTTWYDCEEVLKRLYGFMLDIIPGTENGSLFEQCLNTTRNEIAKLKANRPEKNVDVIFRMTFVRALLQHTNEICKYEFGYIEAGIKTIWEPSTESMYEFWCRTGMKPMVLEEHAIDHMDERLMRSLLAMRILDQQTLRWLTPNLEELVGGHEINS